MSASSRIRQELVSLAVAFTYFGCALGALLLLKRLVLAEYSIHAYRFGSAIVGALVLSKVVLILEHVHLGRWIRSRPAIVEILLRTTLYMAGVVVIIAIEHGVRERAEYGGFLPAVRAAFESANIDHVWLTTFCIGAALLFWNTMSIVRAHLGSGAILRMLAAPPPVRSPDRAAGVASQRSATPPPPPA